jgi:glycosyltransferase involved in cell wall biosynthesis
MSDGAGASPANSEPVGLSRPVFSIVTPSFNQGLYLPDALSSVQGQGNARFEHLVIDGGSTDATGEILASAPDSVRYVMEPDEGQSDALNKGLKMARGTIIGWLNADDFYLPGTFEAVEGFFASHPTVQVVYGDAVIVDGEGGAIRGLEQHGFDASMLLYYGCFIPSTSTFFRSGLIDAGLLTLDTSLHSTMDLELFLRLARAGVEFAHIPRELAAFRWHAMTKGETRAPAGRLEKARIQAAYGTAGMSDATLRLSYRVFQLKHGLMKLFSGAYARQLHWARARGESLRW